MFEPIEKVCHGPRLGRTLVVVAAVLCVTGCASMTQDVDAYYRQMAYNWKEAQEKAQVDQKSLERQTGVLAATGDTGKLRRTQREIERIKAWEAKCAKQEKRFEQAAEWTEKRFHLEKPAITGDTSARPVQDADNSLVPPSYEQAP